MFKILFTKLQNSKIKNFERGFTLIELLIVIALGAILSVVGFSTYSKYRAHQDVELYLQKMGSAVEEVNRRSVTQKDGKRWGMRFTNSTTSSDKYEVFTGSVYSTSSIKEIYHLRRDLGFTEPIEGTSTDIMFEPITGEVSSSKIISLVSPVITNTVGDLIVSKLGLVSERVEDNIVGYWHLDEGTGTSTMDATPNSNDGTLVNSLTWTGASNCKAGQCLSFNGTNQYIDALIDVSESSYTVGLWFKTSSPNVGIFSVDDGVLGGNGHDRHIYLSSGNVCTRVWSNETICTSGTNFADNDWHYVVHEFGGSVGGQKIFIDGVERVSGAKSASDFDWQTGINIGFSNDATADYFNGTIDEVRIYNVALSSSTIKEIYNATK